MRVPRCRPCRSHSLNSRSPGGKSRHRVAGIGAGRLNVSPGQSPTAQARLRCGAPVPGVKGSQVHVLPPLPPPGSWERGEHHVCLGRNWALQGTEVARDGPRRPEMVRESGGGQMRGLDVFVASPGNTGRRPRTFLPVRQIRRPVGRCLRKPRRRRSRRHCRCPQRAGQCRASPLPRR
jgi:hypothetical protein